MTQKKIKKEILRLPSAQIEWYLVPWDSEIMGFPVGQICGFELFEGYDSDLLAEALYTSLSHEDLILVNIRLPVNCLEKTIILEKAGFRFIEITYKPHFSDLLNWEPASIESEVEIIPATPGCLPQIRKIAECAFTHERFHVDPRLNPELGNIRYGNWAEKAYYNPVQSLYAFKDNDAIMGFFVTENLSEKHVYWHLTALAPSYQKRGLGGTVWEKMMHLHQQQGFSQITTCITARNLSAMNLYRKLNFRFTKLEMGFHFLANEVSGR